MRISSIPQIYRNANRWREILSILSKYGLAGWLGRFDFSVGKKLLKDRNGEAIAKQPAEVCIRLAIEELGPTFIKLGQIMSTRPDVVGSELASELEKLQVNVPADSYEQVAATVYDEFGTSLESMFEEFSEEPVASASIGQVHKAVLHTGEVVAVKVQHQNICQRVNVDLDIFMGLAQLAEKIPEFESYRPTTMAAEFQRALRRELDFVRESRHIEEFGQAFEDNEAILIPKVYPALCGERVLVMQWLDGLCLADGQQVRQAHFDLGEIAQAGAEMYLEMIFNFGVYHADPHPGNLLLAEGGKLGLLDFGMVGRIDSTLREDFEDLLLAIVEQDAERLVAVVTRVAAVPVGTDETGLTLDLTDYVSHYANQTVENFDLASAVTEMFELMRRYDIVLPSQIALILKVLVMLEGTAQRLQPDFCLMELLQPYQKKIVARRLSPTRQLRKARRMAYEMQQLAEVLPRRLRDILQQMQSGRFDVHLDHRGLEPSVNRMVLGLLTSALFLGSVQLVTHHVWPLWDVSVPGTVGILMSVGLGLRLLIAINKSGHLDRRK